MKISEFCLLVCLTAVMPSAQNEEEKPKVTLKISKEKKPLYVGDTVTLECSIDSDKSDSTGWKYVWYKNGQVSSRVQQIEEVTVTQAGSTQYLCGVKRADDNHNVYSEPVSLTVMERKVKLELKPDGEIFEGDKISLHCRLDGDPVGWTYEFYNREGGYPFQAQNDSTLTISPVNLSHKGDYWCRAVKQELNLPTTTVRLEVSALQVTLSVSPSSSVKEGDSLNLTCTWTGGKSSALNFTFSFQRNNVTVKNNNKSAVFSIKQADESHGGSYGCAVQLPGGGKSYSNEIEIQVQDAPVEDYQDNPLTIVYLSVGLSLGFLILLLLLFVYHRTRGIGGKTISRMEKEEEVITSNGGAQQIDTFNKEEEDPGKLYSELVDPPMDKSKGAAVESHDDVVYSDLVKEKLMKKREEMPEASPEVMYSDIKLKNATGASPAADPNSLYASVIPRKDKK
ncbi:sialoadhesin-like isoform X1 [Polypterus senegalus]|uniref:sialoadhesin-like isoform X1 n=1 Tax=Polypterus senegalus TaxID=55291 RepID=UPI00196529EB|nr:sialoadhesin-like isoform X1 [Polypterus senegalus]